MSRKRILTALLLLAAFFAPPSKAQLGKSVLIPAGSDEDHQLSAINAADPSQKLQLIDDFSKSHPDGDLQIVADEQYVNYYINAKQYDKAFEYGDKLFALDPDNYVNAVNMIRAANSDGLSLGLRHQAERQGDGQLQRLRQPMGRQADGAGRLIPRERFWPLRHGRQRHGVDGGLLEREYTRSAGRRLGLDER